MFQQKISIPTYFNPGPGGDADWAAAEGARSDLGIAVLNPASGPGYTPSFLLGAGPGSAHDFCSRRIKQMQDTGAVVVGYVTTNYRDRFGVQAEHCFTVDSATNLVTTRNKEGTENQTGWTTGFGPIRVRSDLSLPGGLVDSLQDQDADYYWIEVSDRTGHFAHTEADANSNRAVDVTSPGDPGPNNDKHFMGLSRTRKNIDNVCFEIDQFYERWPNIDGMFFDEMDGPDTDDVPELPAARDYYQVVLEHVRSKPGKKLIIHNPGSSFHESLTGLADHFMTFEGRASDYTNPSTPWQGNFPPGKIWHAIHSCTTQEEMLGVIETSRKNKAGHVYVTDREALIWNGIASYFEAEKAKVREENTARL